MSDPKETIGPKEIDRREFLTKSATLLAGGAALASTALSRIGIPEVGHHHFTEAVLKFLGERLL